MALGADLLPLRDPLAQSAPDLLKPALSPAPDGGTYWLGTDDKGRDILSRLIYGSRLVLFWSILATVVAYAVGMLMGVIAGYRGGWWDEIISFIGNVLLVLPADGALPRHPLAISVRIRASGRYLGARSASAARVGLRHHHHRRHHLRHGAAGGAHRARPGARPQDARLYRGRRGARREARSTSCWSSFCPMRAGR